MRKKKQQLTATFSINSTFASTNGSGTEKTFKFQFSFKLISTEYSCACEMLISTEQINKANPTGSMKTN